MTIFSIVGGQQLSVYMLYAVSFFLLCVKRNVNRHHFEFKATNNLSDCEILEFAGYL